MEVRLWEGSDRDHRRGHARRGMPEARVPTQPEAPLPVLAARAGQAADHHLGPRPDVHAEEAAGGDALFLAAEVSSLAPRGVPEEVRGGWQGEDSREGRQRRQNTKGATLRGRAFGGRRDVGDLPQSAETPVRLDGGGVARGHGPDLERLDFVRQFHLGLRGLRFQREREGIVEVPRRRREIRDVRQHRPRCATHAGGLS
mmetsp:Transcript_104941/g.321487  ORF Transcript_104941/g.321487 Transcript_104941/m.321487 type:complete len:200 (-) Transcript_104941:1437-2036(-)